MLTGRYMSLALRSQLIAPLLLLKPVNKEGAPFYFETASLLTQKGFRAWLSR